MIWLLGLPFCQHRYCPDHGKITLEEFSAADQRQMWWRTTIRFVLVVSFLVAAVATVTLLLR